MGPGGSGDTHVFTTRMPAGEYEFLRFYAFFVGSSINDVVLRAVRAFMAEHAADPELRAMVEQAQRRFRGAGGE